MKDKKMKTPSPLLPRLNFTPSSLTLLPHPLPQKAQEKREWEVACCP